MKKVLTGKVLSDKTQGAVTVEVTRLVSHPIYHKQLRRDRKLHADNQISAKKGDTVKIQEIKPISRSKNWKVIEIVKKHDST